MSESVERLSATSGDIAQPVRVVLGGTGITMFGLLGGRALEYLTRIVAARSLGVEQFGTLVLAVTLLQLSVNLTSLGTPVGIARYVSFAKGSRGDSKEHNASIVMTGLRLTVPLALVVALGYWVGREWIASRVFRTPGLVVPLSFMVFALPFATFSQSLLALLRGSKAMTKFVLSQDVIGRSTRFILLLVFALISIDLLRASLAYLLGFVATTAVAFFFSRKFLPHSLSSVLNAPFSKDLLIFSWPLFLSTLLMQMGGQIVGTLALGYFSTPSAVGLYDIVLATARIIELSLVAVRAIFMPVFTELFAAQRTEDMETVYASISRWIFYLALPATAFILIYNRPIMALFGKGYTDATTPLLILSGSILFGCVVGPTGQILLAIGQSRTHLFLDILYVVVNLSFSILLIPRLSATGAALAAGLAILVWNGTSLLFVFHRMHFQPFTLYHGRFLVYMLTTAGVLMTGRATLSLGDNVALSVGAVVMALAVVGFLNFLAPDQDREFVKTTLQGVFQRKEALI